MVITRRWLRYHRLQAARCTAQRNLVGLAVDMLDAVFQLEAEFLALQCDTHYLRLEEDLRGIVKVFGHLVEVGHQRDERVRIGHEAIVHGCGDLFLHPAARAEHLGNGAFTTALRPVSCLSCIRFPV